MRPAQPVLGVALIVGSVFLMSFGDALIKYNSASFTAWQIFALRSVITVPILLALMLLLAPREPLLPRSLRWVGLRSALMVLMWIAYYAALPLISLSAAAVAFYTAPLFMALLSRPLTGEPVGPREWLGIVLGFVGRPDRASPGRRHLLARQPCCRCWRRSSTPWPPSSRAHDAPTSGRWCWRSGSISACSPRA